MSFKFSLPPLNALSRDQQNAVFKKMARGDVAIISGCPGSGKTTVVVQRVLKNKENKVNQLYLVYAKLLCRFILNQLAENDSDVGGIYTIMKWYYANTHQFMYENDFKTMKPDVDERVRNLGNTLGFQELMLDEAQDLAFEVIPIFTQLADSTFICADQAQDVFGRTEETVDLLDLLKLELSKRGKNVFHIHLTKNYRNTLSIYAFANACAPNINAANIKSFARSSGSLPVMMRCSDLETMNLRILKVIKENPAENVGIILTSIDKVNSVHRLLLANKVEHTTYHSNIRAPLTNIGQRVVTTFHSCKGLEFDIVIIPYLDSVTTDKPQNLKQLYVGMTRAKERLVLLTESDLLPSLIQRVDKKYYDQKIF
jgi:superfamily I DNA/RNA helicase